jgi:colanic acid/amylovoran biosynthesis protein
MKILIVNCHTSNRGDEAAIKALIDELNRRYSNLQITLGLRGPSFPELPNNVRTIEQYAPQSKKRYFEYLLLLVTHGKIYLSRKAEIFIDEVKTSDLILYAPGGPSIGDIYFKDEIGYLRGMNIIRRLKKPYVFYAPSMGPFNNNHRNKFRKKIHLSAKKIIVRDPISKEYLMRFLPQRTIFQALDSAFQYDFDNCSNQAKLDSYTELSCFLRSHSKVVGITITDLKWHPIYSKNDSLSSLIQQTFSLFVNYLLSNGFGVLFIPQLYGSANDYDLMSKYLVNQDCFIIKSNCDKFESYFQQYVISKLYAVVGMRYHSNIFSAKACTPFVSISYEQKMKGFMKLANLEQYCIDIKELSFSMLLSKFLLLCKNQKSYKDYLSEQHLTFKQESQKSTDLVSDVLNELGINDSI